MAQLTLTDINGIGPVLAATLKYKKFSVKRIAAATPQQLCVFQGVGPITATTIITSANALLSSAPEKPLLKKDTPITKKKAGVKAPRKADKKEKSLKKQKKSSKKKKDKKKKKAKK